MKQKSRIKKIFIILGISAGSFLLFLIVLGMFIGPQKPRKKRDTAKIEVKTEDVKPVAEEPELTDTQLITYFQKQWDSVKLTSDGDFPRYADYLDSLNQVLTNIKLIADNDSLAELAKLKGKLGKSKKFLDAINNYRTYGQVTYPSDLEYACERYLKRMTHDPGSVDIEDCKIKGQSKKGWTVLLKYRAKNGFGTRMLYVSKFDVRYSEAENNYYAVSMD